MNEELEYYELLGFCAEGEAEQLVAEGETGPGGRIPFNTDGGLHRPRPPRRADRARHDPRVRCSSCAARPTGRQVEDARVALAHLVGGGSVCTVNLLGVTD